MKKREDYRQLARIYRVLANEARLMIIERHKKKEHTAGELSISI